MFRKNYAVYRVYDILGYELLIVNIFAVKLISLPKNILAIGCSFSLRWFTSYLASRSYKVCVNGSTSTSHSHISGVPQGSVLGARLYTMYTYPMSKIVKDHNLCYHSYADHAQIFVQCENNATDINTAISRLKDCIANICLWMSNSSLKINEQKTELIIFHSSRSPVSVNTPLVQYWIQ